jgi:hypothetical protein
MASQALTEQAGDGGAPASGTAPSPLTDFSARQPNVQVSRTCLDRRYWAVEFDSYECEALPGFRHRAQKSVVLFGPSFVLLTAKHHHCL